MSKAFNHVLKFQNFNLAFFINDLTINDWPNCNNTSQLEAGTGKNKEFLRQAIQLEADL